MADNTSNRRDFLKNVSVAGMGVVAMGSLASGADSAAPATGKVPAATTKPSQPTTKPVKKIVKTAKSDKPLRIGVIGTAGRGTEVGSTFAQNADAVVTHVCDVDEGHMKAAAKAIGQYQDTEPQGTDDLRRILDNKDIDAIIIATPDHWHAPAAILGCQAGKHVYVEKPCSHNPAEGEMLVAAARKHDRVVQHGTQRRSWSGVMEGIAKVRAGEIGKVYLSRGWYMNTRPETGKRTPASVPAGLNWDLWQGPAPRTEYTENVVHYKWHWFWHWGTGELGNNGVHALDVCRWGLDVAFPKRVTAGGGRYHFQDDQETPDTLSVTYDYGDKAIFWEGRSCHPRGFEGNSYGIAFYGDKATLVVDGDGYYLLDPKGKPMLDKPVKGTNSGNTRHVDNFVQTIRGKEKLNCEIEEGHRSVVICHLGNIAYRTGRTLNCDPKTGRIVGDEAAMKHWSRDYDAKWAPKV
ncbi:Gfo/Idh/MocA family protein [Humisphaera borealis]|uniref:Gfo/Idh/MocA family oxidoreductase n=1 Tax=Humisphaera borealis TaxID=2807512 RepID=A0A7M2X053_9BACT|nr:Gfo/Idh/MocA family oxidoreductase [Humisphaera borealis]QOV91024.1 Gfo/Idh/MocA family oxidoreductase [Humisphaera borealis]